MDYNMAACQKFVIAAVPGMASASAIMLDEFATRICSCALVNAVKRANYRILVVNNKIILF